MMKSRCKKTTPPKGKTKKKVGFQRKEKSKKLSPLLESDKKTRRRTDFRNYLYICIMGRFEQQQEQKKEKKEKEKTRREALGKFYFDLAKLVFAALVLGGMLSLFQQDDSNSSSANTYIMMILGGVSTVGLVIVGNKILKH